MLLRREHLTSLTTRKIFIFVRAKNTLLRVFFCLWLNMAQISGCPLSLQSCLPFSRVIIKITSLPFQPHPVPTTRNKQTKMEDVEKGNTNMKKSSSLQDVLGSKNNLKADSVFRCVVFCFCFFFVFFPFDDDDDNGAQNALSRNQ